MAFTDRIDLASSQNNIIIEFASSDYINRHVQQIFEYKLEGFDKTWISTTVPLRDIRIFLLEIIHCVLEWQMVMHRIWLYLISVFRCRGITHGMHGFCISLYLLPSFG